MDIASIKQRQQAAWASGDYVPALLEKARRRAQAE
jgi:hypothetical protein